MGRALTGILTCGICVILGIDMLSSPIIRYKSMDVDLTGFNKPLGILFIITGLIFLSTIRSKGVKHVFEVGKHQVLVKKKNKSWGVLNSLDLYSDDGQLLTFYSTTDKVSAMLLNDFVIDQKAELEIKARDGQQCELIGKNAYAHGFILLKSEKRSPTRP